MGAWLLENSLLTALVMLAVFGLCRLNRRRPALCHLLWLLAFASLVMPPLPLPSAPGSLLRTQLIGWLQPGTPPTAEVRAQAAPPSSALPFEDALPSSPAPTTAPAPMPGQVARPGALQLALTEITTTQWLALLWAVGALALFALSALRILEFHARVRRAPAAPAELVGEVALVASRLGVATPPVRVLEGLGSPAVWCFGRPQLLWPGQSGEPLQHPGQASLIAHELAHLARRDHWVARLDVLVIALCWWNPLFWIIRRQVRDYAELSCDAWALWAYPTRRRVFAEALIDAQESTLKAPMAVQALCATNSEFKNFERRLSMIMKKDVSRQVSKGAAAAALLTTLLVLPGFSVQDTDCAKQASACEDEAAGPCIDGLVEAKRLGQKAEQLFLTEDWDAAIAAYDEVLALDPRNGWAHGRLGYMHVGRGDYDAARAHFEVEVELGHRPETAIYNLACTEALAGDTKLALAHLGRSVRRGFTNVELMAEDADLAGLREFAAYAEALEAAKRCAELGAKLKQGGAELSPQARLKLQRALADIATEDGALQDECGLALLKAKDYEGGLRAFQRQIAVGHEVARGHYNSACALALTGRRDAALEALERAADLQMAYAPVLEDEDLASLRGSERFNALAERLRAPKVFMKKVDGAIASGDYEHAAEALTSLMNDSGSTAKTRGWAAYRLGVLQLEAQQPKRSIASLERAVASGHAVDEAAFHIGMAYVSLGDVDAGMKSFDKAVYLGYAQADELVAALKKCGRADTEEGRTLVKRAEKAAYQLEQEKDAEKKGASSWGSWDEHEKKAKQKQEPDSATDAASGH